MLEIKVFLATIIFSLLVKVGFHYIPESFKEYVQTWAPSFVPREILFECDVCTSFWITVIFCLIIYIFWRHEVLIFCPFVVTAMMKFYSDMIEKV